MFNIHSGYILIYLDVQYTFRIYIYIRGYTFNIYIYIYGYSIYIQDIHLYIQGYSIYIQDIYLYKCIFNIHSGYKFIYRGIQYTFRIYIYIDGYSIYIQDIVLCTGVFSTHSGYIYIDKGNTFISQITSVWRLASTCSIIGATMQALAPLFPDNTLYQSDTRIRRTYLKKIKYMIKNIVSNQPDLLKLLPSPSVVCIPWINLFVALSHRIISKQTENINDILSRKEGK